MENMLSKTSNTFNKKKEIPNLNTEPTNLKHNNNVTQGFLDVMKFLPFTNNHRTTGNNNYTGG